MLGLTENEIKFCHWQICSPKVARAVAEFESTTLWKGKTF